MWKVFLLALVLFLLYILFDFVWFEVMGNFFKGEIGSIARLDMAGDWDVRVGAAFLVYVFMTLGLLALVLHHSGSFREIACYGALYGLVIYGVYDCTNLSILSAWTSRMALVDIAWGVIVNTVVALTGKSLLSVLFSSKTSV